MIPGTISGETRRSFESMAAGVRGEPWALAAGLSREITGVGLRVLAAKALSVAVSAPEQLPNLYDQAAEGWRNHPVFAKPMLSKSPPRPLPIGGAFWTGFWRLMDTPTAARGGVFDFTARAAFISSLVPPDFHERVAVMAKMYPGLRNVAALPEPPKFSLKALDACPPGSLGAEFRKIVATRGDVLEILDRDAWRLATLPPPLPYLNVRSLQCYDLWRLVAGYEDTVLHHIAMAAFQVGQFGHNYSALALAMVLAELAFERPQGTTDLLDTIFTAYAHGRETPPLMTVEWESLWTRPIPEVRQRLGVTAMTGKVPADAVERYRAMVAARRG